MRAVVLGPGGRPDLAEISEPEGDGELVRVLACGLCGSDLEKMRTGHEGRVLGHEVVAETAAGARVALVHHLPCGECERCRSGHESTCERFATETIEPGGFAERSELPAGSSCPSTATTRTGRPSSRSPACSAAPSACPAGAS